MNSNLLHVAVGVITDQHNQVLIAQRGKHQHLADKWEFPGGKVEPGEAVRDALARELSEELGIHIRAAEPLITLPYHYPDKSVLLDVWRVTVFDGLPVGREGQPLRWVSQHELWGIDFPPANRPIINATLLPDCYAIMGSYQTTSDLLAKIENCANRGVGMVLLRLPEDRPKEPIEYSAVKTHADKLGLYLSVHFRSLPELGLTLDGVDNVHIGASSLSEFQSKPAHCKFFGASCHNLDELLLAQKIGCDYAFLSPVNFTASHTQRQPIGWSAFREWVAGVSLPVFGLGGLSEKDLSFAKQMGGQGVAGISSFWGRRIKN